MYQLWLAAALAASISRAAAQNCISLQGSTTCPAFNASSISTTDATLNGLYPFLATVSNLQEFDQRLSEYVSGDYVRDHYANLYGCQGINLANTTDYYARYTTTFLCNVIIQRSLTSCGTTDQARPMCADSCGDFAQSENSIVGSDALCPGRINDIADQLRADFTNCALPADSITGACIPASMNEPDMCGFGNNLMGLCNFCRASTENATDSCCVTSNSQSRCENVVLPVFSSVSGIMPTSATSAGTSPTAASSNSTGLTGHHGLSGGAIAGIVIGSVVGFLLLLGLIAFACIAYRRRRDKGSSSGSTLNQPTPPRKGGAAPDMTTFNPPVSSQGYQVLPDGRVTRFSAMQTEDAPQVQPRQYGGLNEPFRRSPSSQEKLPGVIGGVKSSPGSNGSSPGSNSFSSPDGVASGQSEQLASYRDYYSNGEIHPNDQVSVLWAYQPRAGDEFELERGDMLRVVGIWDDGWATGVRIDERAEDYDGKHKAQRDSGVSHGSDLPLDSASGREIKAFPLVCVCLPEAWKRTVEGDSSTENTSGGI